MRLRRAALGPTIVFVIAATIIVGKMNGIDLTVPYPGTILLALVFLTTYFSGLLPGALCSALTVAGAYFYLSEPGALGSFAPERQMRLHVATVMAVALPMVAAVIRGWAGRRIAAEQAARQRAEAANRELLVLRAALDEVDYGVLLLDEDLRPKFVNRAARRIWREIDAINPDFAQMIRSAAVRGIYENGAVETDTDAGIAERVAGGRAGEERTVDMVLEDGTILRCQCKVLPENRRLLSCTDVTDLIRHAERLETLAMTDEMTGLHNRRQFLALADREWRQHETSQWPLSLMMLDIDHFKSINDRFGHAAGDTVIHALAEIVRSEQRDGNILARIGGEEFVLLMPNIGIERAARRADQLRRRIETSPVGITVSIGVATAGPGQHRIGDLMNAADQALYAAKRGGRNRVERFSEPHVAAA